MSTPARRFRILCARARPNAQCTTMLNNVVDEWIHALALHADVEVIEEDFDLVEVHERLRPDLLLFDSIHWGRPHRLQIANIDAHPELPRALYLNCDPHDPMRPLLMQMLPIYGVEAIFTLGIEQLQQMRELRRVPCFPLPKFIDAATFRDPGLTRTIPVTILSAHLFPSYYPWRTQVTEEIQQLMPTLLYTHPGYAKGAHNPFAIEGESYARIIAQSQFCVADTTRLDYVVRKHLEIPAAGAVLVAPESEALADYGFVDRENCLLGSGGDLYRKIWAVASDPAEYERIRTMGHALVHTRYTRDQWTFILDWLACRQALQPGETVRQDGLFGTFRVAPATSAAGTCVDGFEVRENPMSARLLATRQALLGAGDLASAYEGLLEAASWIHHIAEPWLLLGVIAFLSGDLDEAGAQFARRSLVQGREDPSLGILDPCEIAWIMLFAFVTDDADLLAQMEDSALGTAHVSLRRVQWLLSANPDRPHLDADGLAGPLPGDCLSIHWLGDESFQSWFALVQTVLDVNGKGRFANDRHALVGEALTAA